MPDNNDEDELLARFKALSAPREQPAATVAEDGLKDTPDGEEDDPAEISDADVEAYLAGFDASSERPDAGRDSTPAVEPELKQPTDLELRALLRGVRQLQKEADSLGSPPVGAEEQEQSGDGDEDEQYDEAAVLSKAIDEAALEGEAEAEDMDKVGTGGSDGGSPPSHPTAKDDSSADLLARLTGLAAPSALATSDEPPEDAEASARLGRLLGLDALRSAPSDSKPPVPGVPARFDAPGLSAAREDDVDSWCIMCNQDASVTCVGCDDEPYCTRCWNEGHPPDQVPRHRAKPFVLRRGR